jgi:hypothetical protein
MVKSTSDQKDSSEKLDFLGRYLMTLSTGAILRIITLIAFLSSLISLLMRFSYDAASSGDWLEGWLQNFSTELFGALLTFIVIEKIVGGRARQRDADERRRLDQMNMTMLLRQETNAESKIAIVHEMIRLDLIRGAWLSGLNLQGFNFNSLNLEGTRLGGANLQNANLVSANLRNVTLDAADLRGADLADADMENALLGFVLGRAVLDMTRLGSTQFDAKTKLPDGTYWTNETDMARFINPANPKFWRSHNPKSPAFRDRGNGK